MRQEIKQRDYLFREKPKRRAGPLLCLLAAAGLGGAAVATSEAPSRQAQTRDRAAPQPVFAAAEEDGPRVYGALGGPETFVIEATERGALLRFLCRPSDDTCAPGGGAVARLSRRQADGVTTYRDAAGVPVLRLAEAGPSMLLAGSVIVPASVPAKGRPVLPTEQREVSLASL